MYPDWINEILFCPETKEKLIPGETAYNRKDGKSYPVRNDILSVVFPAEISGLDARMNRFYRYLAPFYSFTEDTLGRLIAGIEMEKGRAEIVSHLQLKEGMQLLEVSPGSGVFQKLLRSRLGANGKMISLDLSLPMLRQCQLRNGNLNIPLIHANAQYLPFADNSFDALFHFGGINLFNDPSKAISEFVRVTKSGGIVAWGDEGFSQTYPDGLKKKILSRMNPGFLKERPPEPASISSLKDYEVYGGLGYLNVGIKKEFS